MSWWMRVCSAACGVALVSDLVNLAVWPGNWPWSVSGIVLAVVTLALIWLSVNLLRGRPLPVSTLTVMESVPEGACLVVDSPGGQELVRVIAVNGAGPFTLTVEATR